jgi:hypothetical protein
MSMVNLIRKSVLIFSRGLKLRRQTGLKVRVLIFFVTPGGLSRTIFRFYMCKLISYKSIKTDTHKYNLKKIKKN